VLNNLAPSKRSRVARLPARGDYSVETIHRILDAAFLCHVGFVVDGQPFVIPTSYGRSGSTLYLHGSAASRMLRTLSAGIEVCLTITLLDGLVLARSAFHHSINYRSVVVFGSARLIDSPEEKNTALRVISEQILPGRWDDVRHPKDTELKATTVLAVSLTDASAKIRTGPPVDDEEDYGLNIWAGILPIAARPGAPIPDPRLTQGLETPPDYVLNFG
jgi:hypothetical protein